MRNVQSEDMPETKRSGLSLRPPSSSKNAASGKQLKNGDHPEQSKQDGKLYDEAFFNPPKPEYLENRNEVKEKVERTLRYNSKMDEDFAESLEDEKTINEHTEEFISTEQLLNGLPSRPTLRPTAEKQGIDDAAESLDEIRLALAKTNYGKYKNSNRLITNLQVFSDKDGNNRVNSSIQVVENENYKIGLINYSAGFINQRKLLEKTDAAGMAVQLDKGKVEFDFVKSADNTTADAYKNSEEVLEDLINKVDKVDAGYMDRAAARLEGVDSSMTVGHGSIDLNSGLLETIALGKKDLKVVVMRDKQIMDASDLSFNNTEIQLKEEDIVIVLPKTVLGGIATAYDQDTNFPSFDYEQLNSLSRVVEQSKNEQRILDVNLLKAKLEEKGVLKPGVLNPDGSFSIMAIQLK